MSVWQPCRPCPQVELDSLCLAVGCLLQGKGKDRKKKEKDPGEEKRRISIPKIQKKVLASSLKGPRKKDSIYPRIFGKKKGK